MMRVLKSLNFQFLRAPFLCGVLCVLGACSTSGSATDPNAPAQGCDDRCAKKLRACSQPEQFIGASCANLCGQATEGQLVCFEGAQCSTEAFNACLSSNNEKEDGGSNPPPDMAPPAKTIADCAGDYNITYKPSDTCGAGAGDLPSPETWKFTVNGNAISITGSDPNMEILVISPSFDPANNRCKLSFRLQTENQLSSSINIIAAVNNVTFGAKGSSSTALSGTGGQLIKSVSAGVVCEDNNFGITGTRK